MATYYKYAEREADSQVNWAEIGKNMSDMLLNEAKYREEKKQELDKLTREQAEVLANYPTGQSESGRAMALKFSNDASQFLYMQDKLLKSGQLKLSDYTVTRQNIIDDTETAFNMLKDYQNRYGIKMDRYKQGLSQKWELEAMERIEGFGNFSESGMYIDPTTGKVLMSKMTVDPTTNLKTMNKDQAQMASIQSVKGMLEGQWDKYDPNKSLDAINAAMGTNIKTLREVGKKDKLGEVKTIEDRLSDVRRTSEIEAQIKIKQAQSDLLKNETDKKKVANKKKIDDEIILLKSELDESKSLFDFEKAETNAINAAIENPWNRLSLMTDVMGKTKDNKTYRFVYSEKEAKVNGKRDESAILMVPSKGSSNTFEPSFTENQKQESTEWMRNQLRSRYKYEEKSQLAQDYSPKEYAPQYVYEAGQKDKLESSMVQQWMNIFSAETAAAKDAAADSLLGIVRSLDQGVVDIDPTPQGVVIKYSDGRKTKTIEYGIGSNYKTGDQWAAAGTILHGVEDQNKFNKYKSSNFVDLKGNTDAETANNWARVGAGYVDAGGNAPGTPTQSQSKYQVLQSRLGQIGDQAFTATDNELATYLNQELGPLGFTITSNDGGYTGNQYVTVTPPAGPSFTVDANSYGSGMDERNTLIKKINEAITQENAEQVLKALPTPAAIPTDQQNVGAKYTN